MSLRLLLSICRRLLLQLFEPVEDNIDFARRFGGGHLSRSFHRFHHQKSAVPANGPRHFASYFSNIFPLEEDFRFYQFENRICFHFHRHHGIAVAIEEFPPVELLRQNCDNHFASEFLVYGLINLTHSALVISWDVISWWESVLPIMRNPLVGQPCNTLKASKSATIMREYDQDVSAWEGLLSFSPPSFRPFGFRKGFAG
jgi:hypothetical protein